MLLPEGGLINGSTGHVSPETGRYRKRLSELRGIFRDRAALEEAIRASGDPIIYEVVEYKKEGSDIFFGTTNRLEFLEDPTGGRRFLPISVRGEI